MSDTVLIALIIAMAVVIVLIVFRNRLSNFGLKIGKRLDTKLETHSQSAGVSISKSSQIGTGHEMKVSRDNVDISEVEQVGNGHKIHVEQEESSKSLKKK